MNDLALSTLIALVLVGLAGGIGISAVGPGGVLPTIGLVALTSLPPATVAGTAISTHMATGLLGTAVYARSGQLRDPITRRTAGTLALAAVVGTPLGVLANGAASERVFSTVLAAFALGAAGMIWRRSRGDDRPAARPEGGHPPAAVVAVIGLLVAVAAGMAGLGGPMLSVPLLVAVGVPMLEALAAAQAQSVVIAGVGTIAYAAAGSVDWSLAVLIGLPEALGVVAGWRIARSVPSKVLTTVLVLVLVALAPYLLLKG